MSDLQSAIESSVGSRGGIVVRAGDGGAVLLDRYARRSFRLTPEQTAESDGDTLRRACAAFLELPDPPSDCAPLHTTLHVALDDVYGCRQVRTGVPVLLAALGAVAAVELAFHFSDAPPDWTPFLRWLGSLSLDRGSAPRVRTTLTGPLPMLTDELKDWWHALDVSPRYGAGWQPGHLEVPPDETVLRDFARYGFVVPVVVYIHAGNVERALDDMDDLLTANQYSGFSLPLASCHPRFTFEQSSVPLPDGAAYVRLLRDAWQKYPHYDDSFQPVAELGALIRDGGWCRKHETPAHVQVLARGASGLSLFRHTPDYARHWVDWQALTASAPADLLDQLLGAYRDAFSNEALPACAACRWRYVCGGTDRPDGPPRPVAIPEALCASRQAVLESLLEQLFP